MKKLSYADLMKAKELNEIYFSGDHEKGEKMYSGLMAEKHLLNIIFPNIGDLSCHVTHGAIFENVVFDKIQFLGANLSLTSFKNCIFHDCSLVKSDLIRSDFINCIFKNCKLFRAKFIQAEIEDCLFIDCDFSRMSLTKSVIKNCIFYGVSENPLTNENNENNVIWNLTSPLKI